MPGESTSVAFGASSRNVTRLSGRISGERRRAAQQPPCRRWPLFDQMRLMRTEPKQLRLPSMYASMFSWLSPYPTYHIIKSGYFPIRRHHNRLRPRTIGIPFCELEECVGAGFIAQPALNAGNLGLQAQTMGIGGTELLDLGITKKLAELPYTKLG